jgi:thymidylate kinase
MTQSVGSKLIIVEGLTGSGKSTTAHFIARQLAYNGVAATWLHEGELPHPILIDLDTSIESYMTRIRDNWAAFVDQVRSSPRVRVVEGCFFNNLLETLWAYKVERSEIMQFAAELQALGEPLNPTLIYLVQSDVEQALVRNFGNRGTDFRTFVIDLATTTPLAQQRGWEGYAGMVHYWQAFVALTDELFERFPYRKVKIDNTAGDWDDCNRQVMACLSMPLVAEEIVSQSEAMGLVGVYRDRRSGKEFTVHYEDGQLTIQLFLDVKTRLVRAADRGFLAEGWHFEVGFEPDGLSGARVMRIGGRDVDYLRLVGTIADRAAT